MDRTESLLNRWIQFISDIRRGYELTIYDYTNELASRDSLTRGSSSSPRAELKMADDDFRLATRESLQVLPGAPDDAAWWWRRVPIEVQGELAADLKAEAL